MSEKINEAKERIAAWMQLIQDTNATKAEGDRQKDQQSLDRAADLEMIYQDGSWVEEAPEPKKPKRGPKPTRDSREQFAKWVKITYGWGTPGYLSYLHTAHELVNPLSGQGVSPATELTIRPLSKLRAQGYGDYQAEVWSDAITLAAPEAPAKNHVSRAVTDFIARHQANLKNLAAETPEIKSEREKAEDARWFAEQERIMKIDNPRARARVDKIVELYRSYQSVLEEASV